MVSPRKRVMEKEGAVGKKLRKPTPRDGQRKKSQSM